MAESGTDKHSLTILWRIENISSLECSGGWLNVESPQIRSHAFSKRKLRLLLVPRIKDEHGSCTGLYLVPCDDDLGFPVDCQWSLLDSKGSTLVGGTERNCVLKPLVCVLMPHCPTFEDVFVTKKFKFLPNDTLIVQFRIWNSKEGLPNDEFISCLTQINTLVQSFPWYIPRFSALFAKSEVTTTVTFGDNTGKDYFFLKFSFKGVSLDYSSVNVEIVPQSPTTTFIAKLKLAILNNEQVAVKRAESQLKIFRNMTMEPLTVPELVSRREIMKKDSNCLKGDILTMSCEISAIRFTYFVEENHCGFPNLKIDIAKTVSTFLRSSCQGTVDSPESSPQDGPILAPLAEDLLNLYQDQYLTDFNLRSGAVSIPVHKVLLSARSPVFKAMFTSDMEESACDTVDIPDIDAHTLNRMLTFLYAGTLEPDLGWENATKLYYAADKYQVQSLKQDCSSILRSSVSVANVSNILTLADRHQDEGLTSFLHDFIITHFDDVMHSKEWESLMVSDPVFAGNTVFHLYKKKQSKRF